MEKKLVFMVLGIIYTFLFSNGQEGNNFTQDCLKKEEVGYKHFGVDVTDCDVYQYVTNVCPSKITVYYKWTGELVEGHHNYPIDGTVSINPGKRAKLDILEAKKGTGTIHIYFIDVEPDPNVASSAAKPTFKSGNNSQSSSIPSYNQAMSQKRIQEQQAEEKRQRQIAENKQNAANFHKEHVEKNNAKYAGGNNYNQSSSAQSNSYSKISNSSSDKPYKEDPLEAMNRKIAASNARDAKIAELGDQMANQIGSIFADVSANRQATMQREREEAAERRAIAAEEKRIEDEKGRIKGLQKDYITSLPESKWPKSYNSYPDATLYYYAISIKNTSVKYSNIFTIVKRTDGSWPYRIDISNIIAKNIEPGSQMQLIGYFRTYNEAVAHQDQQLFSAQNSYLNTGTFTTQLGISNITATQTTKNNDSYNDPWSKNTKLSSSEKKINTNLEKEFNDPWSKKK